MPVARHIGLVLISSSLLAACGNAGDAASTSCDLCGTMNDLSGSIANNAGSQAQMAGWQVVAIEQDTGISRVAAVDSAGLYTLPQVRTDHTQTLALLSPNYVLRAVLSIPVPGSDNEISQWVDFQTPAVPALINNGTIISFSNLTGVNVHNTAGENASSATAQNGIPDGASKISLSTTTLTSTEKGSGFALSSAPADCHSLDPANDPDINCDGLINLFDWDENGNGVIDVFDPDANSDLVADATVNGYNTVQWFKEGVSYIAPELEIGPGADGKTLRTSIKFNVKVNADTTPQSVQMRGAATTFANATFDTTNTSTCAVSSTAWAKQLVDDGQSEDGAANDGVFGQQVILTGSPPQANEVMFFELTLGTAAAPYTVDYAWIWPPIVTAAVSATYNNATTTVQLTGNPFTEVNGTAINDFLWSVSVFDATATTPTAANGCSGSSTMVWSSTLTPGKTRAVAIPASVLTKGTSYNFQVTAQSLDKVPGIPAYSLQSVLYPVK